MAKLVVRTGLLVALICPAIILVTFLIWPLMPQCKAGSIGPAAGCVLVGVNLNWFMNLFVIAFIGAFFLVPAGFLVFLFGKFLARRSED